MLFGVESPQIWNNVIIIAKQGNLSYEQYNFQVKTITLGHIQFQNYFLSMVHFVQKCNDILLVGICIFLLRVGQTDGQFPRFK